MAVGDACMFPGFLISVLTQLFSHASAEVRGDNTPERKVAKTGDRTHNHQVIESNTLTIEPPGRGVTEKGSVMQNFKFY